MCIINVYQLQPLVLGGCPVNVDDRFVTSNLTPKHGRKRSVVRKAIMNDANRVLDTWLYASKDIEAKATKVSA